MTPEELEEALVKKYGEDGKNLLLDKELRIAPIGSIEGTDGKPIVLYDEYELQSEIVERYATDLKEEGDERSMEEITEDLHDEGGDGHCEQCGTMHMPYGTAVLNSVAGLDTVEDWLEYTLEGAEDEELKQALSKMSIPNLTPLGVINTTVDSSLPANLALVYSKKDYENHLARRDAILLSLSSPVARVMIETEAETDRQEFLALSESQLAPIIMEFEVDEISSKVSKQAEFALNKIVEEEGIDKQLTFFEQFDRAFEVANAVKTYQVEGEALTRYMKAVVSFEEQHQRLKEKRWFDSPLKESHGFRVGDRARTDFGSEIEIQRFYESLDGPSAYVFFVNSHSCEPIGMHLSALTPLRSSPRVVKSRAAMKSSILKKLKKANVKGNFAKELLLGLHRSQLSAIDSLSVAALRAYLSHCLQELELIHETQEIRRDVASRRMERA